MKPSAITAQKSEEVAEPPRVISTVHSKPVEQPKKMLSQIPQIVPQTQSQIKTAAPTIPSVNEVVEPVKLVKPNEQLDNVASRPQTVQTTMHPTPGQQPPQGAGVIQKTITLAAPPKQHGSQLIEQPAKASLTVTEQTPPELPKSQPPVQISEQVTIQPAAVPKVRSQEHFQQATVPAAVPAAVPVTVTATVPATSQTQKLSLLTQPTKLHGTAAQNKQEIVQEQRQRIHPSPVSPTVSTTPAQPSTNMHVKSSPAPLSPEVAAVVTEPKLVTHKTEALAEAKTLNTTIIEPKSIKEHVQSDAKVTNKAAMDKPTGLPVSKKEISSETIVTVDATTVNQAPIRNPTAPAGAVKTPLASTKSVPPSETKADVQDDDTTATRLTPERTQSLREERRPSKEHIAIRTGSMRSDNEGGVVMRRRFRKVEQPDNELLKILNRRSKNLEDWEAQIELTGETEAEKKVLEYETK